jgi:cell wall-associated NlpC family hydrolase
MPSASHGPRKCLMNMNLPDEWRKKMRSGKLISVIYLFIAFTFATAQTTPIWTHFSPTGSGPRSTEGAQSTAYDSSTDRLIVFGGLDPFSPCCVHSNDTWVLTNATASGGTPQWQQLKPDAPNGLPQARNANSVVYDPATNHLVIFGGGQYDGFAYGVMFNDVWVLTNANGLGGTPQWIPLTPSGGAPAPREGHGAFYKQATNEMFIFGGGNNGIMSVPNDLWVLKNANGLGGSPTWIQLPQAGGIPGRLEHFALAYDPISNRMTIAGGCCFYTNAAHVLDFNDPSGIATWSDLFPIGPLPPGGDAQEYGYDPASNSLIIQGISPGGGTNATWLLSGLNAVGNTPTWSNVVPEHSAGSPPEGIVYTGGAYNSQTNKFILALNRTDSQGTVVAEVWVLSIPSLRPLVSNISELAADLAKSLVGKPYGYGGKGYDFSLSHYVTQQDILNGYSYYKADCSGQSKVVTLTAATGLDCAGLVMWSYNTAFGATAKFLDNNPIQYPDADAQFKYNSSAIGELDLAPGDLMFFDFDHDGQMDHVAMYIGGGDVIEAPDCGIPIRISSKSRLALTKGFLACGPNRNEPCFRRVTKPMVGLAIRTHSPVSLAITDPDGVTIDANTVTFTERQILREVPGVLYYMEDTHNDDTVLVPTPKLGAYLIKVLPKPGALPTDTYSVTAETNSNTLTLAENVSIDNIPVIGYGIQTTGNAIKPFIPVKMVIKSGEEPATINVESNELIRVAVLSNSSFNAVSEVDQRSLRFGHTGTEVSLAFCHASEAYNAPASLVCHFRVNKSGFQVGDTQGILQGSTLSGEPIRGAAAVRIVKGDD